MAEHNGTGRAFLDGNSGSGSSNRNSNSPGFGLGFGSFPAGGPGISSPRRGVSVSVGGPSPGDDEDEQARYMEATVGGVRVATIYLPNGNPAPGPKFDYKLSWMNRLRARAGEILASEMPVVLGGDFNVIPQDIDCYDPPGWEGDALTRPESRAAFYSLCHDGYTDALRACHPAEVLYSYWDYQAGAWQKDNGVRIDHLLLSPEAADRITGAGVDKGPRGEEKPSDHTPVWVELADPA